MDVNTMLLKFFATYGALGAQSPSVHGCHEDSVPDIVIKQVTSISDCSVTNDKC